MDAEKIMLKGLNEITGLSEEELKEIGQQDLFEMGVLDSLSLIGLLSWLEEETGKRLDLTKCEKGDFSTVTALIATFGKL